MVQNFTKFFSKLFVAELSVSKIFKDSNVFELFFKFIKFPLIGLLEIKENKNFISYIKNICKVLIEEP